MNACRRWSWVVFSFMLCVTATSVALAAPGTQLSVIVIDASNKPVSNAVLELTLLSHVSGEREAQIQRVGCDRDGRCIADNLTPANYAVRILYDGNAASLKYPISLSSARQNLVIRIIGASAAEVVSLGVVRVAPTGGLSTGSAPSVELNSQSLARRGELNVANALAAVPGVTLNRPNGGSSALPVSVMIRGDDPKEAVVELDGNPINSGNSGDFDLSLLDPAAFQSVQIVYGLAPASLVGANTEGGTVNFQTLQPTLTPHGLLSYSNGSFVTNNYTLADTGTADHFGYAVELQSFHQQGEVSSFPILNTATGAQQNLGSGISGSNALAKLTDDLPHDGVVQVSVLTSGYDEDISAALSSPLSPFDSSPGAPFTSYAGSERNDVNTFYSGNVRLPLGPPSADGEVPSFLTASYMFANSRQNVSGPALGLSEYLLNTTDLLRDYSLEYDRVLPDAQLTLAARAQGETLTAPDDFGSGAPSQAQTNHTFIARYTWSGGSRLEYTAVGYLSLFSTFGSSFNPRGAIVWRPHWRTVMRASVGTGFQAPLLSEKIVPSPLPPPDANGLIQVGNPNLTADHTLEFELDGGQMLGLGPHAASAELDLYRVDQKDDDIQFIPTGASPTNPKLSYPINIANSIWQGLALSLTAPFGRGFETKLSYNINQGYPLTLPQSLAGSAGNLVPYEQFQGVPLHRAALSVEESIGRFSWLIGSAYEGTNNDLNQPAFATLQANAQYTFGHTSLTVAGTNLTGVYDGKFTLINAGTPYPGLMGPLLADAYQLQGPAITATVEQHW